MANELEVDAAGLRTAAAGSEAVAAALTTGIADGASGTCPSQAGVAAVLAAAQSVRTRQSHRITGQANDLSVGSARYEATDSDAADTITVTV
ncbi:hypothetical protein [Mycobacterium sp. IS-3022]|uniref:hypothetical protein n=1 Tax=Mycobacterium sp. IS-3022 TaxID=1772277 RepID=UPI000741839A|nr:hypothetical protein [Mycobacterium sp. IS-3022]KUI06006.1 hypothetical protein AU188_02675 [Mycobacterium sp. IS-3022]